MNLQLVYKILKDAELHPHSGVVKVHGRDLAREVQEMARAGLVQADRIDQIDPNEAVITKVTHAGRQFYHTFKNLRSFARQ
jgi:hypothetical protein